VIHQVRAEGTTPDRCLADPLREAQA